MLAIVVLLSNFIGIIFIKVFLINCLIFYVFLKEKFLSGSRFRAKSLKIFNSVNISRQLQQRIDQCQERSYSNRCSLLQQQVLNLLDEEFGIDIENQHRLLQALNVVSCELKDAGDACKMVRCLNYLKPDNANGLFSRSYVVWYFTYFAV